MSQKPKGNPTAYPYELDGMLSRKIMVAKRNGRKASQAVSLGELESGVRRGRINV